MAQYVLTDQVIIENGEYFGFPFNPQGIANKLIPTPTTEIIGPYWVTPYVQGGIPIYPAIEPAYQTSVKPNPSSVKCLRVKSTETGIETYFAILDTDCITSNTYASLANDTTGGVPTMPTVTVPAPIIQVPPASSVGGVNTFYVSIPDNPNSLVYKCPNVWVNGASAPAFPGATSTPAGLVSALNSTYGTDYNATFTLITTTTPTSPSTTIYTIQVASAATGGGVQMLLLGMNIALTPVTYTATVPSYLSAIAVNGCKINGTNALFFNPGIVIGDHNRYDLINSLVPLFEPAAVFTLLSTNKITVTTVLKPTYVTIGGVNTSILFS